MKLTDRNQLTDQLNWRYATKQYDPMRKISAADWATLEEALVLSPSGLGLQPWSFVVVDDPAVRAQLLLASYGQPQVVDASHLVVFTTKFNLSEADIDAHIRRTAEVRGISVESLAGLRTMALRSVVQGMTDIERRVWAANQTYIALGNFVTSAALLGIDATPMEGFEKTRYDDILGLKARGLTASVIATLGYRAADDKYAATPKVRFAREQVVQHV
ncbi:MAG: NAD(P)H-dependent oxidoreductase [Verrucomicrobia bacterium]|nr:NAD(P)H-dependent oxidoreductase [Verrucomicrobiota bacterium]